MPTHPTSSRRDFLQTVSRGAAALAGSSFVANAHVGAGRAASACHDRLRDARDLHRKIPVFLGYCVFHPEQFQPRGGRQSDLEKFDAAGVRTFIASVGFGYGSPLQPYLQIGPHEYVLAGSDEWLLQRQLKRIEELVAAIKKCPRTRLITRAGHLAPGKDNTIGVIIHLIGNNHTVSVDTVDTFFQRGVRATHPAMEYHNRWCSSQRGRSAPILTGFGRKVIARMNRLGIVIDTAHASDASAQAIIEASAKPVNDSHTTSRDLVPWSRGLGDKTLLRVARSGGVVGIHFADHMLVANAWRRKYAKAAGFSRQWRYNKHILTLTKDPDERIRLRNDRKAQEKFFRAHRLPPDPPRPTVRAAKLSDLADAIDYLVKKLGIDHVGIGGDVNGIDEDSWPEGMEHIGQLPRLTAELLRKGYKENQLRKILSDNWRRVYAKGLPR
jgi:microsomal dipeptidase-like Zn-dependent dipeptidase